MSNIDAKLRDLFNSKDIENNADSVAPSNVHDDDTDKKKVVSVDKNDIEKAEKEICESVTKSISTDDNNSDKPITSKDIKFVFDTLSKQAPYDKIQIKQIFYGICSSQSSTKIHHNINSKKSGEGKSYLLKLVADFFPDTILLKFNNMSDKALYHQRGIEAVKNEETGKYEDLLHLLNKLESEIEEFELQIGEENSKDSKQKDRQIIRSSKSQIKNIQEEIKNLKSKSVKIIDLDDK
jgi:hypothetical protein